MKVDIKYLIPLQGEYNAGVYRCPECGCNLVTGKSGNLYEHIIGFSNSNIGLMAVVECPECFKKWHYHARLNVNTSHYDYFLEFIKEGIQRHFKS